MSGNISVAMAVYNGEKFIQEQLDSILVQLDNNDEIIISYDISNDRTWEIIKQYENDYCNVHVIINDNKGVFGNFENAIKHCSKEYIFISDQDDIWAPSKKEAVVRCFEETGCDMVIHSGYHINVSGDIVSGALFDISDIRHAPIKNFVKPEYSGCCTAFTRDFSKVILPIPKKVGAYDHWLGMTGELIGKVCFLNKELLYHRLHGDNVTPTKRRPLKVIAKARFNMACCVALRKIKYWNWNVK